MLIHTLPTASLRNLPNVHHDEMTKTLMSSFIYNSGYSVLEEEEEVALRLMVRQSVSQSVSQYVSVSSTLVGLATRYYFLSECCCLIFAVLFLWGALSDERTGLQFTVQSLNGPSRAELVTILYCLI
jgi:hypothetical protein